MGKYVRTYLPIGAPPSLESHSFYWSLLFTPARERFQLLRVGRVGRAQISGGRCSSSTLGAPSTSARSRSGGSRRLSTSPLDRLFTGAITAWKSEGSRPFHGEEAGEPTVLPEKIGPRIIGSGKGNVSFDLPRENHETPEAGGQDEGASPLRKPLTADRIGMAGPPRVASFVIPPCPTP